MVNGIQIHDLTEIANEFRQFYANLGSNLASKKMPSQKPIESYLDKIPRNINSIMLEPATQYEVRRTIEELPDKTSSGHDGVSNILLKSLLNIHTL